MKKLFIQDRILRQNFKNINKNYFLVKLILKNYNIFSLSRTNAFVSLNKSKAYSVSISDRCIVSINKKKFNRFVLYSRIILLKKIYEGKIIGFKKSVW
jgi:ribosomal protein S14